MSTSTLKKEKHLILVAYTFRGLVLYYHCVAWCTPDVVLERKLKSPTS